jgi:hypothetical protein
MMKLLGGVLRVFARCVPCSFAYLTDLHIRLPQMKIYRYEFIAQLEIIFTVLNKSCVIMTFLRS